MKLRYIFPGLLLIITIDLLAQQAPSQTSNQAPVNPPAQPTLITENGQQYTIQQVICPKPEELVKNGLYWGTPTGGWKSYGESFDTSITSFIGAQWVGVNVGKMICIYKGNLALAFPITIQNDTLTQAPTGGTWGKDLGGYRNCHSNNMADCPFTIKNQVENMQQIYDTLDFFKGKANPLSNPNSNGGTGQSTQ